MKTDTPFPPGCCRNCGAALTGRYCSQCGQRETGRDLRFSDLISEFFGEIFTWDSRIWRTLFPLLFRPGFLTAEFIAGRRARYVPPLRLYLIISFILFLSLSLSNLMEIDNNGSPVEDVVRIVDDPNDASATGLVRIDLGSEEEEGTDAGVDVPGVDEGDGISIGLADEDSPPWLQKLERQVEKNAASLEGEPGEFVGELLEYLPQMMFLMLPLFALLLRICYLFSPYHYLQHLVFSLNYHSFTFLLYLIQMVVERIGGDFGGLFFLCLLVYLPIGLRRVFHSGVAAAIGKALCIYFTYGIMLAVGFAAAAVLALFQM